MNQTTNPVTGSDIVSKQAVLHLIAVGLLPKNAFEGYSVAEFTGRNNTTMLSIGKKVDFEGVTPQDQVPVSAVTLKRLVDHGYISKEDILANYVVREWTSQQTNTKMVTISRKEANGESLDAILANADKPLAAENEAAPNYPDEIPAELPEY